MNHLTKTFKVTTMTSLELVEFINACRKAEALAAGAKFPSKDFPELRHDNFMAKVPQVLGEEAALNFKDSYKGKDSTVRPCYRFPKREACLMAMSYSYELQAKVFDHMTELEARLALPVMSVGNLEEIVRAQIGGIFKAVIRKEAMQAFSEALPALLHGELSKQRTMIRKGETAGQVWGRYKLETKGMRGYPTWFGNKLAAKGCQIEGSGRAEVGGIASRLFDPDKCDAEMRKNDGQFLAECRMYIQSRQGRQRDLFYGHRPSTQH